MSKNNTKKTEDEIPFGSNTELTTTANTLPVATDYAEYLGQGFENHTSEDYAVPFLNVLQSNSPAVESHASARPGWLLNTGNEEFFDGATGVAFIPSYTQHVFVEWVPRNEGGGFVAVHALDSEVVKKAKAEQEFGKYKMIKGNPKSNDLVETFYVYGILLTDNGAASQVIIAFTSTKNKVYKQWMDKARSIQVKLPDGRRVVMPLFAHRYRITTVAQKNKKGSYFNFRVSYDGKDAETCRLSTKDPLFLQAADFYESIQQGTVKAAYETQSPTDNAEEAETDTPFK